MPIEEKQIIMMSEELNALAQNIETAQISLSETFAAIEEANQSIETSKAAMMHQTFNERFEINQKLVYTNDDQRKVAVIGLENLDADYQAMRTARTTLAATSASQKASIEMNRNLHKAKLLVLEYYAKLP